MDRSSLAEPGVPGLVSCIVPAWNAERWLRDALESALGQTYAPIEVIVVDDGSTDGTAGVLHAFAGRVVALRQPNAGPAAALNRGLLASCGEYLAFLDADDVWPPAKIERQLARLRAAPHLAACYGLVQNVWTDEVKIEAEALRGHRIRDPVPGLVTGTLLAPRATFARLGPFADQRHAYALEWALRLKQAGLPYEVLDEVLLVRRYHAGNMSREGADSRDEVLALLKRNLDARRGG